MDDTEIEVDENTSSRLSAIAESAADPLLIAEAAQVEPAEFREFLSDYGEVLDENAAQLLKAAESFQLTSKTRKEIIKHYHTVKGDDGLKRLMYPGVFVRHIAPFRLLLLLNFGLASSVAYGLLGAALVWYFRGVTEAQLFFAVYAGSFKTIISLGLIVGTSIIVFLNQDVIPNTIEAALGEQLPSDYYYHKRRFFSLRRSLTFSIEATLVAFVIFSYCQFPLSKTGQPLMLIAVCSEYALLAYVGRKLLYTGMMLHSLLGATVTRNLFRKRELDAINAYAYSTSTLAVIFVCFHVITYYSGPFVYGSVFGSTIKTFILWPALVAAPALLIVNFYPRIILKKLYMRSIDVELKRLKKAMKTDDSSAAEKRFYLIEVDKLSRDELREHLRLTLSDFLSPIAILIMLIVLLLRGLFPGLVLAG